MNIKIGDIINDLIDNKNILDILRKAHVVAYNLNLEDFDDWILNELNGYSNLKDVPEYRVTFGQFYGLFGNQKLPLAIGEKIYKDPQGFRVSNSLSEIINLANQGKDLTFDATEGFLVFNTTIEGIPAKLPVEFIINNNILNKIVNTVKNYLLTWCLKIEKENLDLNNAEGVEKAKNMTQNFYTNVIYFNGNIKDSNIINGNSNIVTFNEKISQVKNKLNDEDIDDAKKQNAISKLEEIENERDFEKQQSHLVDLKDFLLNVGATLTATLLQNLFNL